jgi:hypothetical protein
VGCDAGPRWVPAEFSRRLHQLATEREKLLRAYYADAIDVAILKREQARINADVADAESQLATNGEKLGTGEADHRPRARPGQGVCGELPEGEGPMSARCGIGRSSRRSAFETARSVSSRRGALRVAPRFTQGLDGSPNGI